ncbi:MAG TPA: hypothetical protein GX525_11285 [Bacilli bacterium]|nr:hypothetical protein [Bacilli bacterium]
MTCKEVAKYWEQFLTGSCDEQIAKQIEAHLQTCSECQEKLEKAMLEQEAETAVKTENKDLKLAAKKQKRILARARWKQRISTGLFWFSIFIIFTIVSGILSGLYYGLGKEPRNERMEEVVTLMTEMTMPNITLGSGGSNVTPYFGLKAEYELERQVGLESRVIGMQYANMRFSFLNVTRKWNGGSGLDVKLYFLNPAYSSNDDQEWLNKNWLRLEKVKDQTVAEVALSLDKKYSIEEVDNLFSHYDLDVVWLAVDTGKGEDSDRYLSQFDGIFGMPKWARSAILNGTRNIEPDYEMVEKRGPFGKVVSGGYAHELTGPSEEAFKQAIAYLKENHSWAEAYPHRIWDRKMKDELEYVENYVNEHGVKIFGVVVTGPTEEILKLKDHPAVTYVTVGEIDWWNWNGNHASGSIHN